MASTSVSEAPGLPAPAPAAHRRGRAVSARPLEVGFVTSFLLIIVVLPIAAVVSRAADLGWAGFWEVVSSPEAVSALKLTMLMATLSVLTTAVFGTIIAWVLVRDSFANKSVVNAIIDLPFALPTIVAGLVIMALYGPKTPIDFTIAGHHLDANVTFTRTAIYVALLFVTLPFVVRSVQPVLIELDHEAEEAARSLGASELRIFWQVVFPSILPGILSGVAMAFARAVGEIGAIVLIAGNLPFKTEVASIYLFHRIAEDPEGSAAVAVVLLAISFVVLLGIGALRWAFTRHERG